MTLNLKLSRRTVDRYLLKKYFRNQCTPQEIEQVMNWFQTDEGLEYLEQRLDKDMTRYADEENLVLQPEIPSDEMLEHIMTSKRRSTLRRLRSISRQKEWWLRIAVVFMVCGLLAASSYFLVNETLNAGNQEPEIAYRIIETMEDQHRLVTLSDGSEIRMNSNSIIEVPETFPSGVREVKLTGEAFFQVESDPERPFIVEAEGAVIRVLGTEFNVKANQYTRFVQVAVSEGRVSLRGENDINGREAILTENTFAQYYSDNGEILIEQTPVENYLSWISGNLYFYNEPLWGVSRYLERLYGVSFEFSSDAIREYTLSTNIRKRNLEEVLDIISQTLGITYGYDQQNQTVTMSARNEEVVE